MNTDRDPRLIKDLTLYFLKLGTIGFGGPVALVGYMQRDLVDEKKWITKEEYLEGFALAQLSPGPLAAQLAIYLGWVRGGVLGAALVGFAFCLPSFLMCVVIALAYLTYGGLSWIQSLFYTVGAAVIGIIFFSSYKLLKKTVANDKLLLAIWAVSALITAIFETEFLSVFLIAGIVTVIVKAPPSRTPPAILSAVLPSWFIVGLSEPATWGTLGTILWFFTKAGAFVFGSGLAIVPFLYSGVVEQHGWLNERQFLDAVAVAMITPGPVVITVAFIGFLVAGLAGSIAASIGTFLPCYLLTVIPAPHFHRIGKYKRIKIFVDGLTAAAIGAVAGACWVLGKKAVIDLPTAIIAVTALALVAKAKIKEPFVILIAAIIGIVIEFMN
jgi:chromate transporter